MNVEELSKEELIKILNDKNEKEMKQKQKVKKYISKYQKSEKGALKSREAYKKYYYANRDKVLQKKKEDYQKKKALKNAN